MTVKKKVLIALLSTTCVAAAATGLAACNPDPSNGQIDPAYTVTAVDQNGNGVEGVTFRIGYYENYTTNYVFDKNGKAILATTDKNGKATFTNFTPEEGISYSVYIAESSTGERVYPYGYRLSVLNAEFDENWYATYEFTYAPSSFADNQSVAIEYYRTFDDTNYDGEDKETMEYEEKGSDTITLSLKKGIHSYFTFQSYKELGTDEGYDSTNPDLFQGSDKLDYNQYWATIAAAGVYTIEFSTSSNTDVTMYNFTGSGYVYTLDQYNDANGDTTPTNEIGVPYNKLHTVSGDKGSVQLELTVSDNLSRATQYFGIYAEADCNVTVKVKRVGDAEEPPEIETETVQAPESIPDFEKPEGILSLMTIDGSLGCVLGDDGYYHVGSKNGPYLLINLTKTIDRVGECSIIDLGTSGGGNPYWATGYIFPVYENNGTTLVARYDYSEFLAAYAGKVNSDGVYPVNEELYTFLQLMAAKGQMKDLKSAAEGCEWLLPCQYYMPSGGMDATGSGTQADPFILLGTTNNLSGITEKAYAQFTATTAGIYTFAVSGCTITVDGTKTGFTEDGLFHVCLAKNESVTFVVTGNGSASITVGNATANIYEPFYGDDTEGSTEPSKGLTPDNAIQFGEMGYSAFVVDTSICEDGVYVYIKPFGFGTFNYALEIKTPGGQIVYDGKTYQYGDTLELTCSGSGKYVLLLKSSNASGEVVNGIYAFEWKDIEAESSNGGAMILGSNSVTLSATESTDGVEYSFTATESGSYIMTVDSDDAYIFSTDFDEYVAGLDGSYIFNLNAGETLYFLCAGPLDEAVSYNVTIAPYTVTGDEAFDDNGGTKHIVVHESDFAGIEFIFVSTNGGTYTISVADDAKAIVMTDAESGNKGGMGTVINTAAGTCSYEFTLEAGGYITFVGYATGYGDGEYDVTITKNS